VAYLRRSTFSPRPLLVTGGRGCGKTAVVKAIAAALEIDRVVLSGKLIIAHALSKLMCRNDI
jgi:MoxR-like ATPase